jgi:hypothetical protein
MQTRAPSQSLCSPTKAKLARDGKTMLASRFFNKEVDSKIESTTTQEFTRPPPTPKHIQEDSDDGKKGQNIQEDTIFIASENNFQSSPKNDVLPSITSTTDASSTVGPMSDIVPPIDDESTLSDVVGYDSLADKAKNRSHAKIMTNTDDNSPPGFDFQLKKQISKAGKDNKNTARTDQRAELSKILARHLKVAHEILYNADCHSLSTDDDFPPPPIKSTILSDEASFISDFTCDNTHAQQHNTINRYYDLAQGKRTEGNGRKEAVQLNRSDYVVAESMKKSERVRKSALGGKVMMRILKEMNLQLMMQLSTRRQVNKKQHQYEARRLKEISNKVATNSQPESSGLRKVYTELVPKVESTTTTDNYSSDVHEDSRKLQSFDLILQLEQHNSQMFSQLQQAELLHTEDLKKIAEINSHQKESIALLELQLKESEQSAMNLEYHLETMIEELIELKNRQDEEKNELNDAYYDKLQLETNLTTELLKSQLQEVQSKSRDGVTARAEGGTDLDSPVKSGKRKNLHQDLSLFDLQK